MKSHGWHRVVPPGNGTIPSGGKSMVVIFDPTSKGTDYRGHMALVTSDPTYDYGTKKWVINVRQVDWPYNHCEPSDYTFTGVMDGGNWGDLYGINFYVPN